MTVRIDEALSDYLQELCRIDLSGPESEKLLGQVGEIIVFVERFGAVDTSSVGAEGFTMPWLETRMRPDEADDSGMGSELRRMAPREEDGFLEVPGVFERTDGARGEKPSEPE